MANPLQHEAAAFGARLPASGTGHHQTNGATTRRSCQHAIVSHSSWYKISVSPIDPRWVAEILQPHMPERTLQELDTLVAKWAARDGYNCICQAPVVPAGAGCR